MQEEGKWITLKDGRRILLKPKNTEMKDTNFYMNNKIRREKEKKLYTEKDMKPLYTFNWKQGTKGYELNGIYLLKNHEWGINNLTHKWLINELEDKVPTNLYNGNEFEKYGMNDTIKYFKTFKEGKEALVKLANEKEK